MEVVMKLEHEDIDVLIEALNEWKHKGMSGLMMATLLIGITNKDEKQREAEIEKKDRAHRELVAQRSERVILLQAKLLQLRDRIDVENMTK
jgi:tRNA A37 threonylcarbamoyladenosine biosynthesis protein TsaE